IRKTKKKEGGARRAQRASSNVFSNFEQTQIQEFKEAFTLIDQNRDGFIDKEDLKDIYASLGKTNVKDEELESMLKEAAGPINFTMFLNLFGAKLLGEFHTIYIRGGQTFWSEGRQCNYTDVSPVPFVEVELWQWSRALTLARQGSNVYTDVMRST
uniref:EF-hand domain-containing protein n=1 Tax=Chelonoidis abingdonii TaxID=106734 RepID=A0A8C0GN88_CHEAB